MTEPQTKYELPPNWETFVCTKESIADVYSRLRQFPILFDDSTRGDYDYFTKELVSPNAVVLKTGDYGICRVSDVVPGRDAQVHLAFWDRRFRGRSLECKQAIQWAFWRLDLQRATVQVPAIAANTHYFLKVLGFKREGVIRNSWLNKGKFMNIHVFGILRELVLSDTYLSTNFMDSGIDTEATEETNTDGRKES